MPDTRSYIYYDHTVSLCHYCHRQVNAKIVFEDDKVVMLKNCPEHGAQRSVISTDIEFYRHIRNYNKASEYPLAPHTSTHFGCPLDCGICPDHEQHSCLTLIEVTDRCNLTCPTCYASSSPNHGRHRSLEEINFMLDVIVKSEGEPDVVQISGGEPTVHPRFFEILDLARTKPIRHLMLNTNGIRIAREHGFAEKLAGYAPDFEIYLQFDSLRPGVLEKMRGENLLETRMKALEKLNGLNLSTTLVVTVERGQNDDEIGELTKFALQQPAVRGITFQPTSVSGRLENFDPANGKITATEIRKNIIEQSGIFQANDLVPVPCNPDALTMAYALKAGGEIVPLTRMIDPSVLLNNSRNTIVYEQDQDLHRHVLNMFSTGISVDRTSEQFHHLLCCLPDIHAPGLGYQNLFRIIIMNFMDAYDFDVRAIKKSCVHIVHPDGRVIPFETMNLFYRPGMEEKLLSMRENRFITI